MSHGHEHKEYKRVFGNVERASRGLVVLCDGESPKQGTDVHQQGRAVCLGRPMSACKTCEHSSFRISLTLGIGDQVVACPVWPSIRERLDHQKPQYEMVRREQCVIRRPYDYCSFCPNSQVANKAETVPGWWEKKIWKD